MARPIVFGIAGAAILLCARRRVQPAKADAPPSMPVKAGLDLKPQAGG